MKREKTAPKKGWWIQSAAGICSLSVYQLMLHGESGLLKQVELVWSENEQGLEKPEPMNLETSYIRVIWTWAKDGVVDISHASKADMRQTGLSGIRMSGFSNHWSRD